MEQRCYIIHLSSQELTRHKKVLIMCTEKNMILMLNTAIGQSGKKAENYTPFPFFFFLRPLLEQKVVIIILHTYTVLYIRETSKHFTNYSSNPQGSHFLGKEVTSDKNLVPSDLPFQSQVKCSRVGGGRRCFRSPQLLGAWGSLLYPFPHVDAAWGPGGNNERPW